jgi:hypothetical protein
MKKTKHEPEFKEVGCMYRLFSRHVTTLLSNAEHGKECDQQRRFSLDVELVIFIQFLRRPPVAECQFIMLKYHIINLR